MPDQSGWVAPSASRDLDPNTVPPRRGTAARVERVLGSAAVDWIFRHTNLPIIQFPPHHRQARSLPSSMTVGHAVASGMRFSTLAYRATVGVGEKFYDMWDVVTTCWLVKRPTQLLRAADHHEARDRRRAERHPGLHQAEEGARGRAVQVVLNFAPTAASRLLRLRAASSTVRSRASRGLVTTRERMSDGAALPLPVIDWQPAVSPRPEIL